ncbi:hypothetical protein Egran_04496 [Elaphomyces granulatus]|uniref:XPG-I domain-containing protein n=1 Tax=Elaphomyces granulatus TaxID=519963 RepID=A0A232LU89_9EURO|nr:hypothetical protein Egran_04496 [Elaphomyces granulatus]
MGIPGLLNAIGSGDRIALSKLAISHLEKNARPIRIAVDISIWLIQAQASRGGQNPELRTLFYRLLKFLALPIHPLFVYDGKQKPPFKRGKATGGGHGSPIVPLSKTLIDLFKFPTHDAPGEAEAECARLQKAGVVDAVMSDDVDALMFGSTFTVMSFSREGSSRSLSATHVTCYYAQPGDDLSVNISLSPAGMALFAMLSGGDYLPSGVSKCGTKVAAEIAKAGFGDDLLDIIGSDDNDVELKLTDWRNRLQYELDENESGYFKRKHKAIRIPDTFPDRKILSYHTHPIVSSLEDMEQLQQRLADAWDHDISPRQIRLFANKYFDWTCHSGAKKVIRHLAEPLVSYRLRLRKSPFTENSGYSLASNREALSLKSVYRSRTHYITDGLSQLQLQIIPADIVGLDLDAEEPNPVPQQGYTIDEEDDSDSECAPGQDTPKAPNSRRPATKYNPTNPEKVWIFQTLAEIGIPGVVERWREEQREKAVRAIKPAMKRSTPRKKKAIDPSMKPGSILRYATVTKPGPKTRLNTAREAQLLDATFEVPSTGKLGYEKTNNSPTSEENGSSLQRYLQQRSVSQAVDDLTDQSEPDIHHFRHLSVPDHSYINIEEVASLDDGVVPVGETGAHETPLSWSPPLAPRGLTTNASGAASAVINQASISDPVVTPYLASNHKWLNTLYANESAEEMETTPSSPLPPKTLSTPRGRRRRSQTNVQTGSCLDTAPSKMTAIQPQVILISSSPEVSPISTPDRSPIRDIPRLNSSPTLDAACEDCSAPKSAAAEESSRECDPQDGEVLYIPSINAYDGFWEVESTGADASITQSRHVNNAAVNGDDVNKDRVERVSILDLS